VRELLGEDGAAQPPGLYRDAGPAVCPSEVARLVAALTA
jgi:hypothetical protein